VAEQQLSGCNARV